MGDHSVLECTLNLLSIIEALSLIHMTINHEEIHMNGKRVEDIFASMLCISALKMLRWNQKVLEPSFTYLCSIRRPYPSLRGANTG